MQISPLGIDISGSKVTLSSFRDNEIDSAKVRYVSYDVGNKNAGIDINQLVFSTKRGEVEQIRKDIKNIYDDILIDQDNKISLVSKIRDNLAVAKYLLENNQPKAAQNTVGATDALILKFD